MDNFANKISNGKFANNQYNINTSTIVNISSVSAAQHRYNDIFKRFYYSNLCYGCRECIDNDVSLADDDISLKLLTQKTFSINQKLDDGSYYVEYGLFSAYYKNEVLPEKQYLDTRFGCDSFIFIDEILANKLVNIYGLTGEDAYKELIRNPNYAILKVMIDNEPYSFSINNILYNYRRMGERYTKLYNSFGLIYVRNNFSDSLKISFDIDLKISPILTKKVLNDSLCNGYPLTEYNYSFSKFDFINKRYFNNDDPTIISLNSSFAQIDKNDRYNILCLVIGYFLVALSFVASLIACLRFDKKTLSFLYLIVVIIFLIFNLVGSFIYIYTKWSYTLILYFTILTFAYFDWRIHKLEKQKFYHCINI